MNTPPAQGGVIEQDFDVIFPHRDDRDLITGGSQSTGGLVE